MRSRLEYYEAPDGWRYRLKGGNNRTLVSAESYTTETDVLRAIRSHRRAFLLARVVRISVPRPPAPREPRGQRA